MSTNRDYYVGGTIPWINSGELNENYIDRTDNYITELGLNNSSAKIFPKGTVLLAMYGATAGKTSILKIDACTNQAICAILENPDYSNLFLKYNLENLYEYLVNTSSGSARDNLSQESIAELTLYFPKGKASQEKLIKVLEKLDQKISLNTRMNAELEAMAKQLYDYWFVQFDFPDENGNPYKSSGGKMVYSPTLKREIPAGWDSCKLGDFCNLYQPKTIGIDEMNINGKYHVYGANGLIGFYDKYNHEESEIVMACRGNSCGVINRTMPFSWITGNAMVLSVKDKSISNEFISQCTNYMNIKGAITGSGQPQLTRENLAPLLMILPSKDILTLFTRKIDFIVREQLHIKTEIEYLTHLRDSLLPMLMNGQVTVE